MIIIVTGLPGSGKSYFAFRLAEMIDAVYINSDQVRKRMFANRTYSDAEKLSVYKVMLAGMKDAVHERKHVVLDATFYKKDIREIFLDKSVGVSSVMFIEVSADEALVKERLKRTRIESEADFDVYTKVKKQWEPLEMPHLRLQSTDDNINDMLRKAMAYLNMEIHDVRTDR